MTLSEIIKLVDDLLAYKGRYHNHKETIMLAAVGMWLAFVVALGAVVDWGKATTSGELRIAASVALGCMCLAVLSLLCGNGGSRESHRTRLTI